MRHINLHHIHSDNPTSFIVKDNMSIAIPATGVLRFNYGFDDLQMIKSAFEFGDTNHLNLDFGFTFLHDKDKYYRAQGVRHAEKNVDTLKFQIKDITMMTMGTSFEDSKPITMYSLLSEETKSPCRYVPLYGLQVSVCLIVFNKTKNIWCVPYAHSVG